MRVDPFIITADHIFNPTLDLKSKAEEVTAADKAHYPIRFRLYDDDGILYYEGRAKDHNGIEAAHDWAQWDAGVTISKYFDANNSLQHFIS